MFSVSPAIAWLIAGIAVLGAEIFLGTAYLLVVAFAFGATAAGAAVGLDFTMQLVVCAAVLAGGCLSVIAVRRRNAGRKDPSAKLQHLDSGQWVTVDVVGSDGLAVVHTGVPPNIYAFHRYTRNSAYLSGTQASQFPTQFRG